MEEMENEEREASPVQIVSESDEECDTAPFAEAMRAGVGEVLEVIRFESRDSRLSSAQTFDAFDVLPEGVDPEAFSRALAAVLDGTEAAEAPQALEAAGDAVRRGRYLEESVAAVLSDMPYSDIEALPGSNGALFYSSDFMTASYARWSYLADEGDDAVTFAFCVREESRTYPRPMKASSLDGPPLALSAERLAEVFEEVRGEERFADIRTTSASNGDVYYYSVDFLSDRYAQSLAEWYSVERWESY